MENEKNTSIIEELNAAKASLIDQLDTQSDLQKQVEYQAEKIKS